MCLTLFHASLKSNLLRFAIFHGSKAQRSEKQPQRDKKGKKFPFCALTHPPTALWSGQFCPSGALRYML